MPIHELVHSIRRYAHIPSLRLSSLFGQGITERMRATGFALLGLTAAAGLALVAIFAQPGFPLLDPVPLPEEPAVEQSVGEAERVTANRAPGAIAPALASVTSASGRSQVGSRGHGPGRGAAENGAAPGVRSPASPVGAPAGSPGGGGGTVTEGGGSPPAPTGTPAPEPAPEQAPAAAPPSQTPAHSPSA